MHHLDNYSTKQPKYLAYIVLQSVRLHQSCLFENNSTKSGMVPLLHCVLFVVSVFGTRRCCPVRLCSRSARHISLELLRPSVCVVCVMIVIFIILPLFFSLTFNVI